MPHLEGMGRVIAPDLIGQGDSDKLPASDGPDRYSFQVAYGYLAGLLEELDANQNVTLVIHDWGSALGFYWAQQHGAAVKGIAYMEGQLCLLTSLYMQLILSLIRFLNISQIDQYCTICRGKLC